MMQIDSTNISALIAGIRTLIDHREQEPHMAITASSIAIGGHIPNLDCQLWIDVCKMIGYNPISIGVKMKFNPTILVDLLNLLQAPGQGDNWLIVEFLKINHGKFDTKGFLSFLKVLLGVSEVEIYKYLGVDKYTFQALCDKDFLPEINV